MGEQGDILTSVAAPRVVTARKYSQLEFDIGLPPVLPKSPHHRSNGVSETAVLVAQFHSSFGLHLALRPALQDDATVERLRVELLLEEVGELEVAIERRDLVGIADALGDILYVTYGAALTWGIDLDRIAREVHRANMSKLGPDGRPILRDDGKVLKSEAYVPPDIRKTLLDQPPLFLD